MCQKKVGDCNNCLWEFDCTVPNECPGNEVHCEDCRLFRDCYACIHDFDPDGDEE